MSNRVKNHRKRREDGQLALTRVERLSSNRKQRREAVRGAGVVDDGLTITQASSFSARFAYTNKSLPKANPIFLGIHQFKRATRDHDMVRIYKQNAWASYFNLLSRRAGKDRKGKGKLKDMLSYEP